MPSPIPLVEPVTSAVLPWSIMRFPESLAASRIGGLLRRGNHGTPAQGNGPEVDAWGPASLYPGPHRGAATRPRICIWPACQEFTP
jgi:hypothetical protein